MEFKLESQVVGVVDQPKTVEPTFKFIEVEVTRTEGTTLFLKVPSNFDNQSLFHYKSMKLLVEACKKTCGNFDWDNFGWEESLEVQSVNDVSEKEASQYKTYEIK